MSGGRIKRNNIHCESKIFWHIHQSSVFKNAHRFDIRKILTCCGVKFGAIAFLTMKYHVMKASCGQSI